MGIIVWFWGEVYFDKQEWRRLLKLREEELSINQVEGIYRGDYLEGSDWPWADIDRENYMNDYVSLLTRYAKFLARKGEYESAEKCLCNAYVRNPYNEQSSLDLIQLYIETHQRTKAILHFNKFKKVLKDELDIQLSKEVVELISTII